MSKKVKAAIIAPVVATIVGIVSAVGAVLVRRYRQAKEVIVDVATTEAEEAK